MEIFSLLVVFFSWLGIAVCSLSLLLFALGYYFRDSQNAFLYFPDVPPGSVGSCESPAARGLPRSEHVRLRTADGATLRGFLAWPAAADRAPRGIVAYFHGNAGNVGHRIAVAAALTARHPLAVLMVDYRGYGLSDRREPSEAGLAADAQACLEFVRGDERLAKAPVFVMGTSLGGAVALRLAAQRENARRIAGVIVENSFTSVGDMASVVSGAVIQRYVPRGATLLNAIFNHYIKPLCLHIGWRSIDLVEHVHAPILFISGLKDEIIPPAQMRQLYIRSKRSSSFRKFVEIPEAQHNNAPFTPGYAEIINNFISDVLDKHASELV